MNMLFFFTLLLMYVSILVSSLEYLKSKSIFAEKGILEWNMLCLRENIFTRKKYFKFFTLIYGKYAKLFFIGMLLLSLCSILALLYSKLNLLFVLNIALTILIIAYNYRSRYALDGADQFSTISLTALSFCFLLEPKNFESYFLFFVGFQLSLSYFIAGIYKLTSLHWLSGKALTFIFAGNVYGNKYILKVLKGYPKIGTILSTIVIIWEVSFPVCFFLNNSSFIAYLMVGIFFHLFNAIFMGLNCFFISFVSGYPALIYCYNNIENYLPITSYWQ